MIDPRTQRYISMVSREAINRHRGAIKDSSVVDDEVAEWADGVLRNAKLNPSKYRFEEKMIAAAKEALKNADKKRGKVIESKSEAIETEIAARIDYAIRKGIIPKAAKDDFLMSHM